MQFANGVAAAVGRTPLIKLKRASEETGCTILGKAEFMNPGQSVKDRAALYIIQDAVKRGTLRPGGTVVEGTAGNTGIGLTVVGNALGFRTVIVIPETQSQEKKDALRLLGAELVEVPALPYKNPNNYVHYSQRLAEALAKTEPNGAIWANQWDNTANRRAHIETTAEEIWADTDGKVDGFVSAVGSGGTLGGVSDGLKAKRKDIQIALADVPGAALYSYYTTGVLKAEGSSITEGIGQGRITKNIEGAVVDRAYLIPDAESVPICFQLLQEEGLCMGGSTGVNVAGAIRLAKELGPATPSSPCCATTARATSPSCSTRSSCARRTCRCRSGSPTRRPPLPQDVRRSRTRPDAMTEQLYRADAYLRDCEARVLGRQRARRHRARPHRVLCRGRRPAGRQGRARDRRRRQLPDRHDGLRRRQDHHRARAGRGRSAPAAGPERARRARLGHALQAHAHAHRACTCCARW